MAGMAVLDPFEAAAQSFERPRSAWRVWCCDRDICDGLPHGQWLHNHARPQQQIAPVGDWNHWLFLAGRGTGKTRAGAEDMARYGVDNPGSRIALVGPTFTDARDTMVEGESGLLGVLERYGALRPVNGWNRSLGEIFLINGTRYKCFSADEPERLRGPQHHRAWADEPGSWRYADAWDQLTFGLRLGRKPRCVITGTPRNTSMIRDLVKRGDVHITRGATFDNAANLADAALATFRTRYEGTRLGRQELYAELLLDTPGALVTMKMIDDSRIRHLPDTPLANVVVAIDPAITNTKDSDETGILVMGALEQDLYALEDCSGKFSPDAWARQAINAYVEWEADALVYESNQGGDMVRQTIVTTWRAMRAEGLLPDLAEPRIIAVHASRGKRARAEPIAALYEQGRMHHVGALPRYEDQWTTWVPGVDAEDSPDRMDAGVWGATVLAQAFSERVAGGRFGRTA